MHSRSTKSPRRVWVERSGRDAWLVRFVDRRPRQRHLAGQFDRRVVDLAGVVDWIEQQPHLQLDERIPLPNAGMP